MIDDEDLALQRRGRRRGAAVLVVLAVTALVVAGAGRVAYHRYESFGTVWADKSPPKVTRCGREWERSNVETQSADVPLGLVSVGSTAGGAAILSSHAGCPDLTTVIWIRLTQDHFVAYVLSGGP